jgi:hypothetical protein
MSSEQLPAAANSPLAQGLGSPHGVCGCGLCCGGPCRFRTLMRRSRSAEWGYSGARGSRRCLSTRPFRRTKVTVLRRSVLIEQPGTVGGSEACSTLPSVLRENFRARQLDGLDAPPHAARTVTRNFSTADLSWVLSVESARADCRTCVDAEPVWTEPWLTSAMFAATSAVPAAACPTLVAISRVITPCVSTAEAISVAISDTPPIVMRISLIALTVSEVDACIPATCAPISSVALAVWAASAFTSCATTAKPLPASSRAGSLNGRVQSQ